jgi:hypothetical protein
VAVKTQGPYPGASISSAAVVKNIVFNLPDWSVASESTVSWDSIIKPISQVNDFFLTDASPDFRHPKTRVNKWTPSGIQQVGALIDERLTEIGAANHVEKDSTDPTLVHFYNLPNLSSAGFHTSTYRIDANGLTFVQGRTVGNSEEMLAISGDVVVKSFRNESAPYSVANPYYELRVTYRGNPIPVQQPAPVSECKRFFDECKYNRSSACSALGNPTNPNPTVEEMCPGNTVLQNSYFYPRIIAAQVSPEGVVLVSTRFGGIYFFRLQ